MKKQNKQLKPIPVFKTEDEERKFWDNADTTEYFDMDSVRLVRFPNLKYSTESISLRLPVSLLDDIKIMANKIDVPYQSYIKMILADKVQEGRARYLLERQKKVRN